MNKIYVFYFNYDFHESAPSAMSFHRTMAGAYKAMKKHLYKEYEEWQNQPKSLKKWKFGQFEGWFIRTEEVSD